MAYEVVIPRLGLTMEEAQVVQWYKQDGEPIQAGELMISVETDKTVIDVEAPCGGFFYRVPNLPSEPLPIGYVIGYILEPGEDVPDQVEAPIVEAGAVATPVKTEVAAAIPPTQKPLSGKKLSSPAARRRAKEFGIDWTEITRLDDGPILIAHVEQYAQTRTHPEKILASPLARRVAKELSVDLAKLAAQKPGQKISRDDVEAFAAAQAMPATPPLVSKEGRFVPFTMTRRTIAKRMADSAHTTAPVTLTTEADVTELVAQRERMKADLGAKNLTVPTYTDLIIKLTSVALQEHPGLNASLIEDKIILHEKIHIGLAVDTDEGLLVPVISDVPSKSIQEIAIEARTLADKARERKLQIEDLHRGTFTVTNLGAYGVDAFTPIIKLPECAILGIGRIITKPAVHNGEITQREMMVLSLTFDHRVVDGGPAARFLATVCEYAEHPYLWLVR
jgi:pyruvate dehydrogenase E2 component (dihydrolipoamide acetyltransferase)